MKWLPTDIWSDMNFIVQRNGITYKNIDLSSKRKESKKKS